jgi:hypothetical protein
MRKIALLYSISTLFNNAVFFRKIKKEPDAIIVTITQNKIIEKKAPLYTITALRVVLDNI